MKLKRRILIKDNGRSPLDQPPLRQAGQSDAEKVQNINIKIVIFLCFAVFFALFAYSEWLYFLFQTPPQPIIWSCIALIAIVFCGYNIIKLLEERKNWDLGRQGEIEVSNYVDELRTKGYEVFHDIQCNEKTSPFNIDHLIVSPQGIFAIETKTRRKRYLRNNRVDFDGKLEIKISGHGVDIETVPSALSKSKWLSDHILPKRGDQTKYPVFSIIVFPGWSVIGAQFGKDAWVINHKMIQWEIPKRSTILTNEEINSISQVLKNRNR